MGRRIPPYTNASIHPIVSFSLLTICMAATIIVIAALCGGKPRFGFRKSQSLAQNKTEGETGAEDVTADPSSTPSSPPTLTPPPAIQAKMLAEEGMRNRSPDMDELLQPIPTAKVKDTSPKLLISKTQRRKLSATLSTKMGAMGLPRMLSCREDRLHIIPKKKKEDSLWTKTIILGEKCKVPDPDKDEDDDAVFYDTKGKPLPMYTSRNPRSVPVSRSNSFTDQESAPL